VIKKYAPEFLGRQEVQHMLDRVAKTHPKVIDDLVPNMLPLGTVLKVLKNLLREEVSVRDLLTILETLADASASTTEPTELTERVRHCLARQIAHQHGDANGTIHYINLSGQLEGMLREGIQRTESGQHLVIEPAVAQDLVQRISAEVEKQAAGKVMPVILSAPAIRAAVRRLTERLLPQVAVLSPAELTDRTRLKRLATVSLT
jgi:flagellar biosynthesis protein FlhA